MLTMCRTRREFLVGGSLVAGSLAASSQLLPKAAALSFGTAGKSNGKLRGLMVDAGRVPETFEYYKRVIDFCAEWKFNALQFRLADDQGCAIRFASVPDLLFHENAFAPEQLQELASYAGTHGVDLIPELESFGHTGYITRSAAYAHLLDADSHLSPEFTGVIPVDPQTMELFKKLYREIASVFPSVYLHGGCDEVNWGGSSLSRKALQTKQRYEIWADYLNSLNHVAVGLGKQFIVWGDVVLHKEPKILGELSKNIIVMDWNYRVTEAAKVQEALSTVRKNGFRGIGAPALINYRWGARPGTDQLANIDAFADAYVRSEDAASLGVILTNWVPSRYIQSSIWDGFAYAAVSFGEGSSTARKSGFRRFVEKHYGADWNDDWDQAFRLFYDSAPQVEREDRPGTILLKVPWCNDQELTAMLNDRSGRPNPFTRLGAFLAQLEKQTSKNHEDFKAFALSATYLEHLHWRESILAEHSGNKTLTQQDAASLIKNIAERDRVLAEELSKDWNQGRFPNSTAKLKPLYGLEPKDQLVFQFQRAADYSATLALRPERFLQLLTSAKPA